LYKQVVAPQKIIKLLFCFGRVRVDDLAKRLRVCIWEIV
jgi:hypothetical protein